MLLVVSFGFPLLHGVVTSRTHHPLSYCVLRVVDDTSYCAGVWAGILRTRKIGCLLPVVSVRRERAR